MIAMSPDRQIRGNTGSQWRADSRFASQLSKEPGHGSGNKTWAATLQLGDTQVDETKLKDLCGRYRVREPSFFGSAAGGDIRPDSDIDLLVDSLPDAGIDLVDYAGLMLDLSHLHKSCLCS